MRVLIIGVGAVGSVIAKHLARSEEVSELIIADKSIERAKLVASEIGRKKITLKRVNAADSRKVSSLARNADLLINATLPRYNIPLMKACLEAGTHYIDLASDDTDEQLEFHERFKEAGLTAIICMGEDPGISNILARYGAGQLSKTLSIKIRDCESSIIKGMRSHLTPLFSKEVYFSELSESAYIYQNGRIKRLPPLSGYEEYEFPPPIGRLPVYAVSHEEVFTLPRYIKGVRYVDFKLFIPPDVVQILRVLKVLGLLSRKKVRVDGQEISPAKVLYAVLPEPEELIGKVSGYAGVVVEVAGRQGRKPIKQILYTIMSHEKAYKEFGTTATAYLTGTPPAITAQLIANQVIKTRGVVPPEALPPEPLLQKLTEHKITITNLTIQETVIKIRKT